MDFKDYFRDELAYLHAFAQEFVLEYPELSPFLSPDAGEKDVQVLFEHFAFLTTRARQKVEDAFPELTHPLLERLFPLPLRPLPSATVLNITTPSSELISLTNGTCAHTMRDDKKITFAITRDITVLPMQVTEVETKQSPKGTTLALTFHCAGDRDEQGLIKNYPLDFYLGESSAVAAQLQLWFSHYLCRVEIETDNQVYSIASLCDPQVMFEQNKFTAILPVEVMQYAGLQRMSEYISLLHLHNFLHLDFTQEYSHLPCGKDGIFQLRFYFTRLLPLEDELSHHHFQLNCVPAINLFEQVSQPQQLSGKHHLVPLSDEVVFHSIVTVSSNEQDDDVDDSNKPDNICYQSASQFLPQFHANNHTATYYQVERHENIIGQVVPSVVFLNAKGDIVDMASQAYFTYKMRCIHTITDKMIAKVCNFYSDEDVPNHLSIHTVTPCSASQSAPQY